MPEWLSRTELIYGSGGLGILRHSCVAVFGIGGVGGYAAEALARSGIGALDLIDSDKICATNINRQIYALNSTLGRYKVDVAKERIADINPAAAVNAYKLFYSASTAGELDFSKYDYIVDAIDTISSKVELILYAQAANVRIISSMGAGNKKNASAFEVADIYNTKTCPLARIMRKELRARNVNALKVVYSQEIPTFLRKEANDLPTAQRQMIGSNAFVPAVAGLIIAGEVVNDLVLRFTTP